MLWNLKIELYCCETHTFVLVQPVTITMSHNLLNKVNVQFKCDKISIYINGEIYISVDNHSPDTTQSWSLWKSGERKNITEKTKQKQDMKYSDSANMRKKILWSDETNILALPQSAFFMSL